jgi:hypothetical protein
MKKMYRYFLAACTAALLSSSTFGQSADDVKRQSIQVSYLLALGKHASQGEINYWMGQPISGDAVKTLYELHRRYLQENPEVKKDMIRRSFRNSYGRTPNESEVATNMKSNWTYTEWMNNHSAWLKKSPSDYEAAIKFAYQNVLNRQPSSSELSYWKGKGTNAYYVVASCVEQCKNSGRSSNCASNVFGTSSRYSQSVSVVPSVATSANGLIGGAGANVIAPGGGNVISAGGGNVVAAGGLN